jgi:Zn-dependent alcohol dehydrogenase
MITNLGGIADINSAFEEVKSGRVIRAVLTT